MKKVLSIMLAVVLIMSLACCGTKGTNEGESVKPSSENISDDIVFDNQNEGVIVDTHTVTFPTESPKRLAVETDAATAVNAYIVARMYLDKFLQYELRFMII